VPTLNLASRFFEHARHAPDRLALSTAEGMLTYGDLEPLVRRIAAWLLVNEVSRLGILAQRGIEAHAGILGASAAAVTYVPLSPKSPPQRLSHQCQRSGVDALIVDASGLAALESLSPEERPTRLLAPRIEKPGFGADGAVTLGALAGLREPVAAQSSAISYILYTSGTTGEPKGVMVSVANVRAVVDASCSLYGFHSEDRFSGHYELVFDASVLETHCAFVHLRAIHSKEPAHDLGFHPLARGHGAKDQGIEAQRLS
jgi:non-ribosomal peptide synthetase component F